jgi:hypothetical protein
MVAGARACADWQLTSTPRHKDNAMDHSRRIAVTLAGLAAVSAFSALPALAAAVPPPGEGALQTGPGPVQKSLPVVAGQLRAGKAWEHRRKFGGVGPAVGGRCPLNKDAHHMARRV